MYNRQVLADHFNGKRGIDDPEVQREFLLLKQQAEIDWKEMYAGKDTRVTVESIAEDYIYNAQLTAKTQRLSRPDPADGRLTNMIRLVRMIFLALIGPIALSLWGAIYFGFRQTPYIAITIWAAFCTVYELWKSRDSFRHMFNQQPDASIWFHGSLVVEIVVIMGAAFLGAQSFVYFLVVHISH